jgi:hypothetical protein
MAPYCALQDTMHASWSAMDRMKRRDVAGDRGSGESGNKFYSEGAQFSSCWEIPQARTAARVELGPLGSKADLARTAATGAKRTCGQMRISAVPYVKRESIGLPPCGVVVTNDEDIARRIARCIGSKRCFSTRL